jgi:hypothetical protein
MMEENVKIEPKWPRDKPEKIDWKWEIPW